MRNLKKFLAVILAVAVMASAMIPAFAEEAYTYEAQAEALFDLGLISGDGVDFAYGRDLTRAEGITMALKLFGYQEEADAITDEEIDEALAGYADADAVKASWAKGWLAIGVREGIVSGNSKNEIDPGYKFTGKMLAALILKLMGQELTAETYNKACVELANIGGLNAAEVLFNDAQLNRDAAFGIMYAALGAQYEDGTTIADALVDSGVIDADLAAEYGLVETTTIASVENIEATVNVGDEYALPETVTATMSDETTKDVAVTWDIDAVDTSAAGEVVANGTIEGYEDGITATITVEEVALAVDSVTAINTKQVAVKFNKAVDATKGATAANYTIAGANPADATVQDDGLTVVLTLTGETKMNNAGTAAVKVLKAVGLAADYSKTIDVVDTTVPAYASIKAVGSKTLEISFSEPVYDVDTGAPAPNVADDVNIDTSNITVKSGIYTYVVTKAVADYAKSTITVTLGTNLIEGNITVKLNAAGMSAANAIRDFAGLVLIPKEVTYTYAKDTTVATATLTSVNKATKVAKVTFSKPVYGANVKLYHSVNGTAAYGTAGVTKAEVDAATVWSFTFTNALPSGTLTFYLVNDSVAANQLTDLYGVKIPNQSFTYEVVADTTPPTVSDVKVNTNASIEVKFSEAIDTNEIKAANFEILKPDGSALSFVPTLKGGTDDTVLLTAALVDNTTYTVTVKSMKDAAGNSLAQAYSVQKAVGDNVAPTATAYSTDANTIYVVFSEDMNSADIANMSNYLVDVDGNGADTDPATAGVQAGANGAGAAKSLDDEDTLTVVSSKKVKITFADGGLTANSDITIGAVKDLAGKKLVSETAFSSNVDVPLDTLTYAAAMIATNKVKLTFSKELSVFDATDFTVAGANLLAIESNSVNSSGKSEVVLVLDTDLASNAKPNVTAAVSAATKSTEGTVVTSGAVAASDKVAPTVNKVIFVNSTRIDVVFEEALESDYFAGAGANGFSVSEGTLTSALPVGVDSNTVRLVGSDFTVNTDVSYNGTNGIKDMNTNALAAFANTDELTAAEITVTAASPANNTFTITDNFDATAPYATGDVDMDTATAGIQDDVTVNGVTYTVVVAGGVATVTAANNSTANAAATTATIAVIKDGVTKNVTMSIPVATATTAGANPTFN